MVAVAVAVAVVVGVGVVVALALALATALAAAVPVGIAIAMYAVYAVLALSGAHTTPTLPPLVRRRWHRAQVSERHAVPLEPRPTPRPS